MKHSGKMESMRGRAKTSAERGRDITASLPSHRGEGESHGHLQRSHSSVPHTERKDRFSAGASSSHAEAFHSGSHKGGGFDGRMQSGGISNERRGPIPDHGPRKGSSRTRNHSGKNGSKGSFVRSGITSRSPDIID